MRKAIGLLLLLASAHVAAADIFKCKNADGSTSFSDRPCEAGATALSVPKSAQKDAPVSWLCEAENARTEPLPSLDSLGDKQRTAYSTTIRGASAAGEVKSFYEHGNVHVCVRPTGGGANASVLSETVIMTDGATWLHSNGRTQRIGASEDAGGAGCMSRVTACLRPGDPKMGSCVEEIPVCGAGVTGACCPEDCISSYKTARKQGMPLADAVERLVSLPVCSGTP